MPVINNHFTILTQIGHQFLPVLWYSIITARNSILLVSLFSLFLFKIGTAVADATNSVELPTPDYIRFHIAFSFFIFFLLSFDKSRWRNADGFCHPQIGILGCFHHPLRYIFHFFPLLMGGSLQTHSATCPIVLPARYGVSLHRIGLFLLSITGTPPD